MRGEGMSPVAIVTASDSGIGQESAKELAESGFDVGITYRTDIEAALRQFLRRFLSDPRVRRGHYGYRAHALSSHPEDLFFRLYAPGMEGANGVGLLPGRRLAIRNRGRRPLLERAVSTAGQRWTSGRRAASRGPRRGRLPRPGARRGSG